MPTWRRHQLAHLSAAGWDRLLAMPWSTEARACVEHWARERLPLVVTRQPRAAESAEIALALSAPTRWQRLRIAISAPRGEIIEVGEFPHADAVTPSLPAEARELWTTLCEALRGLDADAHVYGSHGWESVTGLDHLRAGSDIDVWIGVRDATHADAVVAVLRRYDECAIDPRLDGELIAPDGTAVAWREWAKARAGGATSVMVKRLDGIELVPVEAFAR